VQDDFETRFADALRRRLWPNASLYIKQIASGVGRSENSISRWLRGETHVSARDLFRIARFFARRGDRKFLYEIFEEMLSLPNVPAELERRIMELLRAVLDQAGHAREPGHELEFWCTDVGKFARCTQGHAEYVQRALRLPGEVGDLIDHATGLLGWIAITSRADGVVTIRHDGKRVTRSAAERACHWLEEHSDQIQFVRRVIRVERKWIETLHANATLAAEAIAKVAYIIRLPRRRWEVTPLRLEAVNDGRLVELLRVYRQSPEHLIHAAASTGAFTTSNVLGVDGENVVLHHIATAFGWNPRVIEGYNVLSRPDTDYALMVRDRILRTRRDGANYNALVGTIEDHNVRYLNLALPEPGPKGRVLTSSVLLEAERIVA
jgi:transcriptional regulator with XRE-family HTH domain